ncbi:MAG: ComF family protein [Brevinema sp.]
MYKSFLLENHNVDILGSLHGVLGDELRALKQKTIEYPRQIMDAFKKEASTFACDAVTYIPSNKKNVMAFFAKECASILDVPVWDGIKFSRPIEEQKHLVSREERKENVHNAFELKEMPPYSKLLLIDDVFASGETLKEVLRLFNHHYIVSSYVLAFVIRENFLES